MYGLNLWYFILFGAIYIIRAGHWPDVQTINILTVLMLHSFAMVATMFWIYILYRKIILSMAALIVLESIAKVFVMLGIAPAFVPFVWGMYGYSSAYQTPDGFWWPIVAVIQVVYCLTVVVLPLLFKTLILRSVRIW